MGVEQMNMHDATEQAYKNGYEAGMNDAIRQGYAITNERKAKWIINSDGYYPECSNCWNEPSAHKLTKYCEKCGCRMTDEFGKEIE